MKIGLLLAVSWIMVLATLAKAVDHGDGSKVSLSVRRSIPTEQPKIAFNRVISTRFGSEKDVGVKCSGADDSAFLSEAAKLANDGWVIIASGETCAGRGITLENVRVEKGGLLEPLTGSTIAISGNFEAGAYQTFTNALQGQGTISFTGNRSLSVIYPQWWGAVGDDNLDCGPAFLASQVASKTSAAGLTTRLIAGVYRVTSQQLVPYSGMTIVGDGAAKTHISWNGPGYWIDEQNAPLVDRVDRGVIQGLTIQVSAAGLGFLRLGDRTRAFSEAAFHDRWVLRDLEIYGQGRANSVGVDLTQVINLRLDGVLVNNFDVNYYFTTLADSTVVKLTSQSSHSKGVYIRNAQPGVVGASMDGTVFVGTIINGLQGNGTGLDIESAQNPTFSGGFIESSFGAPTAVRIKDSFKINLYGLSIARNVPYLNVFDITDSGSINLDNCAMADLGDATSTSSVKWSAANSGWDTWNFKGGIQLKDCPYALARQFEGLPWVTVKGNGGSPYPGLSSGKQPIVDQTSLWFKQLLNLQGAQNISETSLVVDANHSQAHYDATTSAKIIPDLNASVKYGIQIKANSGYGLAVPYPSEIRPGTYELIGRLRTVSGVSTPAAFVVALGVGNLVTETFSAESATTRYKTFSIRFSFSDREVLHATSLQAFFVAPDALVIDYVALRPAANDVYLAPYVPPDFQLNNSVRGAEDGQRIFSATAVPTAGTFELGDFVYNKAPSVDRNGMLLLGWSRLTKGSTHVLGTDWARCYVKTTSP